MAVTIKLFATRSSVKKEKVTATMALSVLGHFYVAITTVPPRIIGLNLQIVATNPKIILIPVKYTHVMHKDK